MKEKTADKKLKRTTPGLQNTVIIKELEAEQYHTRRVKSLNPHKCLPIKRTFTGQPSPFSLRGMS